MKSEPYKRQKLSYNESRVIQVLEGTTDWINGRELAFLTDRIGRGRRLQPRAIGKLLRPLIQEGIVEKRDGRTASYRLVRA